MSASPARPFLSDLRRLDAELALPIPDRIRFLRELEYDLEELRAGLEARGVAADEARRRAREALLPDAGVLGELGRMHGPLYRRLTRTWRGDRLRLLERATLAAAAAVVLVVQTAVVARADLLDRPSPFLWPVLVLGALLFALCLAKAFELGIVGDHRAPARGLGAILALAGGALAIGFVGVLVDTWALAATLEARPGLAEALGTRWLVRECALAAVAVLVALAGGLAWFVLSQWVAGLSGARRLLLGFTSAEETSP